MGITKKVVLIFIVASIVLPEIGFSQNTKQTILGSFWNWLFEWFSSEECPAGTPCIDELSCQQQGNCVQSCSGGCCCQIMPTSTSTPQPECPAGTSCISQQSCQHQGICMQDCSGGCCCQIEQCADYGQACNGVKCCSNYQCCPQCNKCYLTCPNANCCGSNSDCPSHLPVCSGGLCVQGETCCCCKGGCGVDKSCQLVTGAGGCGNKICPESGFSSVCDSKFCQSQEEKTCCCSPSVDCAVAATYKKGKGDCKDICSPYYSCDASKCEGLPCDTTGACFGYKMGICTSKSTGCAQGWVRATAGDQWCYKNYRYDACCCGTPAIPTTTVTTQTTRSPTSTATQTTSATTSSTTSTSTTTTTGQTEACCCPIVAGIKCPTSRQGCRIEKGSGTPLSICQGKGLWPCIESYCKGISHSYGKMDSVWSSQLTYQTKENLWIVYGSALSRDNPVVIAENVDEVKYTPEQKGSVKILTIVFNPEVKVYRSNLQVT